MRTNTGELSVPVAVVLAGVIIGLAIIATSMLKQAPSPTMAGDTGATPDQQGQLKAEDIFAPVDDNDHVRGNRDAEIMLVEYSDIDCPFCTQVHTTLTNLVDVNDGKVAWVYRHFPLEGLHPYAYSASVAAECIAQQNADLFWPFIDNLFADNSQSTVEVINATAEKVGADMDAFATCFDEEQTAALVAADAQNASDLGFTGTPSTIVVGPNGELVPVSGAQSQTFFQQIIDGLLEESN